MEDAEFAAYQPLTGRLMTRFRDRDRTAWKAVLKGFANTGTDLITVIGDTSGGWVAASEKLVIHFPGPASGGDSGTRVSLRPDIEVVQAGTGSTTVEARIAVGANSSGSSGGVSIAAPGSFRVRKNQITLEAPAGLGPGNVQITVEFKISTNATVSGSGRFYLDDENAENYVENIQP